MRFQEGIKKICLQVTGNGPFICKRKKKVLAGKKREKESCHTLKYKANCVKISSDQQNDS
jgi:hypothetical protein